MAAKHLFRLPRAEDMKMTACNTFLESNIDLDCTGPLSITHRTESDMSISTYLQSSLMYCLDGNTDVQVNLVCNGHSPINQFPPQNEQLRYHLNDNFYSILNMV